MRTTSSLKARPHLERPARAPSGSRVVLQGRRGTSYVGELRKEGRILALVAWNDRGRVVWERFFDLRGRPHGLEREFYDSGRPSWQVPWRHGRMHGLARQFDERGATLVASRFERGEGADVIVNEDGVQEIREMRDGKLHGLERWGDPRAPYEEGHWLDGKRNGVFRRWNEGALEEGYPRYFVDDVAVSAVEYRRARRARPELPADVRSDDRPARTLPACLTNGRVVVGRR